MRTFIGYYLLLLNILCCTPSLIAYEHDLAVCAIFQNEARFLKEWIEFYKLIGVQKFYLYDHKSTDNYKEVLDPYIKSGESAYNDCLKKVRGKVKWLAVLDIDEFLFPTQHDNLLMALKNYESYAGVCVSWLQFGTSNVDKVPDNKLMIESLTMRATSIDYRVKSIVQPDRIIKLGNHKPLKIVEGYSMVYVDKTPLNIDLENHYSLEDYFIKSISIFRINHYWTRDKEFLYNVKIPRIEKNYFWIKKEKKAWVLKMAVFMNAQRDLAIQRFVKPLKQAMAI
ncbi:MAG: glycosyltransferase family 92 protein [Candidatus Dependentiae bacterium]|nr:glycosyltransferase family 92 protein [Candidatus Dependentiae bacterium]